MEPVPHEVVYVLMEMRQETDYAPHHIQKVVAFFGAMRLFAQQRATSGFRVFYLTLDDARNRQSLTENLDWIRAEVNASKVSWQMPDEYRLDQQLTKWSAHGIERKIWRLRCSIRSIFTQSAQSWRRFSKARKPIASRTFTAQCGRSTMY